jgi:hypothetical protein
LIAASINDSGCVLRGKLDNSDSRVDPMGKKIQYANGKYSPWQIFGAANAYYALSDVLTVSFPEDPEAMARTDIDMSAVMASATNRILALELYLKALLVGSGVPVPMVHNLVTLFNALPDQTREVITLHYDQRSIVENLLDLALSVVVCFQLDAPADNSEIRKTKEETPIDLTLLGLLERNNDGFIDFRYLFQRASASQTNLFEYEYRRLAILCKLLRDTLDQNLIRVAI